MEQHDASSSEGSTDDGFGGLAPKLSLEEMMKMMEEGEEEEENEGEEEEEEREERERSVLRI